MMPKAWSVGVRGAILGGLAAAGTALAGPENIQYPASWANWERYATVDRTDVKQVREIFASPELVKVVRAGKSIPDGTVLAMAIYAAKVDAGGNLEKDAGGRLIKGNLANLFTMEKRKGWGADYPMEWRNGEWEYAAFTGEGKPNQKANGNIKACFDCHKPHENKDYVVSLDALMGKAAAR